MLCRAVRFDDTYLDKGKTIIIFYYALLFISLNANHYDSIFCYLDNALHSSTWHHGKHKQRWRRVNVTQKGATVNK